MSVDLIDCREAVSRHNLAAAMRRLDTAARANSQNRQLTNAGYYGTKFQLEEVCGDLSHDGNVQAVVTRNRFGCLVLNAADAMFIDIDLAEPNGANACDAEQQTLRDIGTVLAQTTNDGFRLYRTAAGVRALCITRPFDPRSVAAGRLMRSVGADKAFVRLCREQNSFRARLSPKPWRCGVRRPPGEYPRSLPDVEHGFADWLRRYDDACRNRATCRYLGSVGCLDVDERIAPLIAYHDRETRAFETLALA